jgi:putative SOS response-associated peptidase YedK
MCGRFVSASPPDELARYFDARPPEHELEPSFNVAPTAEVYVVRAEDGHRQLTSLRWGLVPFWAKEAKVGAKMINARAESLVDKPAFRNAVRRRRCLIPADGFYEWAKVAGHKAKQPYYIHRADGEPLVFAGLWERWRGAKGSEPLETCAIVTCRANATMASIHDRMPCLLPPTAWDRWLASDDASADGEPGAVADLAAVVGLLVPAPDDLLTLHPVGTAVNRAANNGPELLAVEPDPLVASGFLGAVGDE